MAKKNPFQKPEAGGQPPAEAQAAAVEVAEAKPEAPEVAVEVAEVKPEVPVVPAATKPEPAVDKSKFSKEEAKAYIAKQFEAKIPVEVIALQDGEHPRPGQWKLAGKKFKLEKAELYSHRWMKLA